jgi:hypothetical protein
MDLPALAERDCGDAEQRPPGIPARRVFFLAEVLRQRLEEPFCDLSQLVARRGPAQPPVECVEQFAGGVRLAALLTSLTPEWGGDFGGQSYAYGLPRQGQTEYGFAAIVHFLWSHAPSAKRVFRRTRNPHYAAAVPPNTARRALKTPSLLNANVFWNSGVASMPNVELQSRHLG